MLKNDGIAVQQCFMPWSHSRTLKNILKLWILSEMKISENVMNVWCFKTIHFNISFTASSAPDVMSSWRARTDKACSMTNTHWAKSGGTFYRDKNGTLHSKLPLE